MKISNWVRVRLYLCLSVVAFLACANLAKGQATTADLLGTVTDSSGAVVPGAKVTVTNTATGVSQTVQTGPSGDYTFTLLQVGTYSLKIESPGFKTVTTPSIGLSAGDRARQDAKMEVGDVAQTVTVEATASPALQTETSTLGTLVTAQAVEDLPLNGRNVVREIQLTPGVTEGAPNSLVSGTRPDDRRQTSAFSVNGQSDSQNNQLVDGMDNNERIIGGIGVRPSIDAIQEVNVSTNLYSAEFGRTAGGVVNIITKSGGNDFHGSAYEFFRNKVLNTNPNYNFANSPTAPVNPPFRQNQYGGSIGGPIRKDKTFFFGDFEQFRAATGVSLTETVPTAFEENSVKNTLAGAPGNCNCADFTDIGGHQIARNTFNPIGLAYFSMFPAPTASGTSNNFVYTPTKTQKSTTFDIRLDHHISDRDTIFGRYSFNDVTTLTPTGFPNVTLTPTQDPLLTAPVTLNPGSGTGVNGVNGFPGKGLERQQAYAVSYAHVINSNTVLNLKANYFRSAIRSVNVNSGQAVANALGFPCNGTSCVNIAAFSNSLGLPNVAFPGSAYTNLGDATFTPLLEFDNSFQYSASLSWLKGNHSIKTGVSLIRRQATIAQSGAVIAPNAYGGFGLFNFGGYYNGPGQNLADLLQGDAGLMGRSNSLVSPGMRTWEPSTFVQDDWHAKRWLTLNLGIRYDIFTPYTEKRGRISNYDPAIGLLISPTIPGAQQAGPTDGVNTDYTDIAPRFGFAATLPHNAVLRGGFGLSFFPTNYASQYYEKNAPFNYSFICGIPAATNAGSCNGSPYTNNTPANFNLGGTPAGNTGGALFSAGEPVPVLNIALATTPAAYAGQTIQAIPFNFPDGYLEQANLEFQKQIGANVFNIGWAGEFGHHLGSAFNINQKANNTQTVKPLAVAFPYLAGTTVVENGNYGVSAYNALQTSFVRRFSHGLTANIGYTWSHALGLTVACTPTSGLNGGVSGACFYDNPSAVAGNPSTFTQVTSNSRYGWGNTGNDVRHRFVYTLNYDLPTAHSLKGAAGMIVNNWSLNVAGAWQTGLPFTVTNAGGVSGNAIGGVGDNPDEVSGASLPIRTVGTNGNFLNLADFKKQTAGTFGVQGPNQFFGPPQRRTDFSLFKNFPVTERLKLQFRTEVFNLFNQANFATPAAAINAYDVNGHPTQAGNFGRITALNSSATTRQIQFALKVLF